MKISDTKNVGIVSASQQQMKTDFCCDLRVIVLVIFLMQAVDATSSFGCLTCNTTRQIPPQLPLQSLAGGHPTDQWFVINISVGDGAAYNDSKRGILTELYISSTLVDSSNMSSAICAQWNGTGVVPPYDADVMSWLPTANCAWLNAKNIGSGEGCPLRVWLDGKWNVINDTQRRSSIGSDNFLSCNNTHDDENLLALCSSDSLFWYGVQTWSNMSSDVTDKAYPACTRRNTRGMSWTIRSNISDKNSLEIPLFEDLVMPYAATFDQAQTFCRSIGGFLATITNDNADSLAGAISSYGGQLMQTGLSFTGGADGKYYWADGAPYDNLKSPSISWLGSFPPTAGSEWGYNVASATLVPMTRGENAAALFSPFACSRLLQNASLSVELGTMCFEQNSCEFTLTLSTEVQWYNAGDTGTVIFVCSAAGACPTLRFVLDEFTKTVSTSVTPTSNATCGYRCLLTAGYGFHSIVDWLPPIVIDALHRVIVASSEGDYFYAIVDRSEVLVVKKPVGLEGITVTPNNTELLSPILFENETMAASDVTFALNTSVAGTFAVKFIIDGPNRSYFVPDVSLTIVIYAPAVEQAVAQAVASTINSTSVSTAIAGRPVIAPSTSAPPPIGPVIDSVFQSFASLIIALTLLLVLVAVVPLFAFEALVRCFHRRMNQVPTAVPGTMSAQNAAGKTTWKVALISGTFLPLFSDPVRNNIRSRWLLLATFATAAILVLASAVFPNLKAVASAGFAVAPPVTFDIGAVVSPFSLRLADSMSTGVSGVTCGVIFVFAGDCKLNYSQWVDHPRGASLAAACAHIDTCYSKTDELGIATFSTCRVSLGPPGPYLVLSFVDFNQFGYDSSRSFLLRDTFVDFGTVIVDNRAVGIVDVGYTVGQLNIKNMSYDSSSLADNRSGIVSVTATSTNLRVSIAFMLTQPRVLDFRFTANIVPLSLPGGTSLAPITADDGDLVQVASGSSTAVVIDLQSSTQMVILQFVFDDLKFGGSGGSSFYLGIIIGNVLFPLSSSPSTGTWVTPFQLSPASISYQVHETTILVTIYSLDAESDVTIGVLSPAGRTLSYTPLNCSRVEVTSATTFPVHLDCTYSGREAAVIAVRFANRTVMPYLRVPVSLSAVMPELLLLDQSAFNQETLNPVTPLHPRLLVLDRTSNPVSGVLVSAQLVCPDVSSGATVVQDLQNHVETITCGSISSKSAFQASKGVALSVPTDQFGYAAFSGLKIQMLDPSQSISLIYCVIQPRSSSLCVSELSFHPATLISYSPGVLRVSSTSIAVVPGTRFWVTVYRDGGADTRANFLCALQDPFEGQPVLSLFDSLQSQESTTIAEIEFPSNSSEATLYLGLVMEADGGMHRESLLCNGGAQIPINFFVLTTPELQFTGRQLTTLTLQSGVFIHARAMLAELPVVNLSLEATLTPIGGCPAKSLCGVLDPNSQMISKTDNDGIATFWLLLKYSSSAKYLLTVQPLLPSLQSTIELGSRLHPELLSSLNAASLYFATDPSSTLFQNATLVVLNMLQELAAPTEGSMSRSVSTEVLVVNPVSGIEIFDEGDYDFTIDVNSNLLNAGQFRKRPALDANEVKFAAIYPKRRAKLLLIVSSPLLPVPSIEVTITPSDFFVATKALTTVLNVTRNVFVVEVDFAILCTSYGSRTFQIQFTSQGCCAATSRTFTATDKTSSGIINSAEFSVIATVGTLSPSLLYSVPRSSNRVLVLSLVTAAAAAVFSLLLVFVAVFSRSEPIYIGYYIAISLFLVANSIAIFVMLVWTVCAYPLRWYSWRSWNDEARALKTFHYAAWIVQARISQQLVVETEHPTLAARLYRDYAPRWWVQLRSTNNIARSLFDEAKGRDTFNKQLRYVPELDPSTLPFNFYLVVGISGMVIGTLALIMYHVYAAVLKDLNDVLAYLPEVQSSPAIATLNEYIRAMFVLTAKVISQNFPPLGPFANKLASWGNINLQSFLQAIQSSVKTVVDRLPACFWVAWSLALAIVIFNAVRSSRVIRSLIAQVRRRELVIDLLVADAQSYVGTHCVHFVFLHQLVFWTTLVILLLVNVDASRKFVASQLQVVTYTVLSASAVFIPLTYFANNAFTIGSFTVTHPEYYTIWNIVAVVLSLFHGIAISVIRFFRNIAIVFGLFAALEYTPLPSALAKSDQGHASFLATVNIEAKNSNPLYLLFSSILILSCELKRLHAAGVTHVTDELLFEDDRRTSNIVVNLGRILVRQFAGATKEGLALNAIPMTAVVSDMIRIGDDQKPHRKKARRRWFLLPFDSSANIAC